MRDADAADLVLDHYEWFFKREPQDDTVFQFPVGTLQVLAYEGVFKGCTTFCTLGYGPHASALGIGFKELVLVADAAVEHAPKLLAFALIGAVEHRIPCRPGVSLGGLGRFAPEFVTATGKSALYFTQPFMLPPEFAHASQDGFVAHFHLAVPISAAEHELNSNGGDLEQLLSDARADPFDVRRASVV